MPRVPLEHVVRRPPLSPRHGQRVVAKRLADDPIVPFGAVAGYGAIFNAGVVVAGGRYHLFARGIRSGYRRNPGLGARYLDYVSDVLVFVSDDGLRYEFQQVLARSSDDWIHAIEDPRVQRIRCGGVERFVMTYTHLPHPSTGRPWQVGAHELCFDGDRFSIDPLSMRILGPDGVNDKDAVVCELADGRVALFHRIHPDIQVAVFDDLDHLWRADADYWDTHLAEIDKHTVIRADARVTGIGAGAPPVVTDKGLLFFFHERLLSGTYTMNVALLDPSSAKVVAVLGSPVLVPERPWELQGDVDDVIFVGGAVARDDGSIYLTYGAADRCVGAAAIDAAELLEALLAEQLVAHA